MVKINRNFLRRLVPLSSGSGSPSGDCFGPEDGGNVQRHRCGNLVSLIVC